MLVVQMLPALIILRHWVWKFSLNINVLVYNISLPIKWQDFLLYKAGECSQYITFSNDDRHLKKARGHMLRVMAIKMSTLVRVNHCTPESARHGVSILDWGNQTLFVLLSWNQPEEKDKKVSKHLELENFRRHMYQPLSLGWYISWVVKNSADLNRRMIGCETNFRHFTQNYKCELSFDRGLGHYYWSSIYWLLPHNTLLNIPTMTYVSYCCMLCFHTFNRWNLVSLAQSGTKAKVWGT